MKAERITEERITEESIGDVLLQKLQELTVSNDEDVRVFIKEALSPYFSKINESFKHAYQEGDSSLKHCYIALDLWGDFLVEGLADGFLQKLASITDNTYSTVHSDFALIGKLSSLSSGISFAQQVYKLVNGSDTYMREARGSDENGHYVAYLVATLLPIVANPKESLKTRHLVVDILSSDTVETRLSEGLDSAEYPTNYAMVKNDLLFLKFTKEVLGRKDLDPNKPSDQETAVNAFLNIVNPAMRNAYTAHQKWGAYRALLLPNLFNRLESLSFTILFYYRILSERDNKKPLKDLLDDFKKHLDDQSFSRSFSEVIEEQSITLEYIVDIVKAAANLSDCPDSDNFQGIVNFSPSESRPYDSSIIDAYEAYKTAGDIIRRISTFYDVKFSELVDKIKSLQEVLEQKGNKYLTMLDRFDDFIAKLSKRPFVKEHFALLVDLAEGRILEHVVMEQVLSESDSISSFKALIAEAEQAIASKNSFSWSFFSKTAPGKREETIEAWLEKEGKKDNPYHDIDWNAFINAVSESTTVVFQGMGQGVRKDEQLDLRKGKIEEEVADEIVDQTTVTLDPRQGPFEGLDFN